MASINNSRGGVALAFEFHFPTVHVWQRYAAALDDFTGRCAGVVRMLHFDAADVKRLA